MRKKKWLLCGLAVLFFCSIILLFHNTNAPVRAEPLNAEQPKTTEPQAEELIEVYLDGELLEFDVPPQIISSRTMVPMRVIFEALGANVQWGEATKTVTATKDDLVIQTTIGDKNMYVNNVKNEMDIAPVIINSRTLVPVRFVSEALGADVEWDEITRTVYIYSRTYDDDESLPEFTEEDGNGDYLQSFPDDE